MKDLESARKKKEQEAENKKKNLEAKLDRKKRARLDYLRRNGA